jgi:hypothetical protein
LIQAVQESNSDSTIIADRHDTYEIVIPLQVAQEGGSLGIPPKDTIAPTASSPDIWKNYDPTKNDKDAIPYTLQDETADFLPGNAADDLTYDNTGLTFIDEDEEIEITITTATGASRQLRISGHSLRGAGGGAVIL